MGAEAAAMSLNRGPRGRLRYVLAAAGVVAAVVVFVPMLSAPAGPAVRRVAVAMPSGAPVSPAAVRTAAAGAIHGGLLRVNLDAVRAAVERLPWVASAQIRRVWPDAIAVRVTAEHPVARWGEHGLVDARGHVFSPGNAAGFDRLPVLSGPADSAADVLSDYRRVRRMARPAKLRIAAFGETARGDIRVGLAGGPDVELGRDEPVGRFARFVNIAVPALGAKLARAATVDVRYPNGFAVGWKGEGDHGKEN